MRFLKTYILLSLLGCSKLVAQEVIIQPPIFTSLECTEFFKLFTGSIMNFSGQSYETLLYFEVDYTSPNGIPSRLADGVFQGVPTVTIPEGTTPVNSNNYEMIYPQRRITFYNRDIEDLLTKTKCLPPGHYDVCLTLYPANTNSFDENYIAQTCYERDKVMLNQLFLVSPFEHDEILVDLPLFTWTAIMPFNPQAMYRIQIVELLANQTPFEAFRSNPIFFEETRLRTNIFQYPVPARTMLPCTRYAWRIIYELDGRFIDSGFLRESSVFQQSEIWEFSKPCDEEEEEEEEEIFEELEPKYFYRISSDKNQNYQSHRRSKLSIEIDNSYKELSRISYSIIDQAGNRFDPPPDFEDAFRTEKSINPTYVKSGKNHFTINLDELGLTRGNFYTLKVNGFKEELFVKFKYEEGEK